MILFLLRRFPFWLLAVLLVACGLPDRSVNPGTSDTPEKTPTPLLAKAITDVCPVSLNHLSNCLTPLQLRIAYGIEPLVEKGFGGQGQTVISIAAFASPTLAHDMQVYDQTFGLLPIDLQVIAPLDNVAGHNLSADTSGWADETEQDVQIIHALAPNARVIVLLNQAAATEGTLGLPAFRQLEQYVLDQKLGHIVSQSWGISELLLQNQEGQQEIQRWNTLFQKATTEEGLTYFASSGDTGATDYADPNGTKLASIPTTSFPADSPWVTAVGGTTLAYTNTGSTENAWSDVGNGGSSGGGFSRFYQTPNYQQHLPPAVQSQLQHRRGVPDVSADADPSTGLAIDLDGQWTQASGTSASAPIWAAIMAIADQMAGHPLGFINPALYMLATSRGTYARDFHDITEGNNTNWVAHVEGYPAQQGWDAITGLGSPNAEKLIPDLLTCK